MQTGLFLFRWSLLFRMLTETEECRALWSVSLVKLLLRDCCGQGCQGDCSRVNRFKQSVARCGHTHTRFSELVSVDQCSLAIQ
eukprot:jgi/Botrbrau1/9154/Bobra.160_3s0026.1